MTQKWYEPPEKISMFEINLKIPTRKREGRTIFFCLVGLTSVPVGLAEDAEQF